MQHQQQQRHGAQPQRFNPHPPLRADATLLVWDRHHRHQRVSILTHPYGRMQIDTSRARRHRRSRVSILTHPYGRMQQEPLTRRVRQVKRVSILTHPYGRMQQGAAWSPINATEGFNPHPPLRADATSTTRRGPSVSNAFQSSPTLTGGCNSVAAHDVRLACEVSILTHPYGRMQLPSIADLTISPSTFQSSPTLTGGCNVR